MHSIWKWLANIQSIILRAAKIQGDHRRSSVYVHKPLEQTPLAKRRAPKKLHRGIHRSTTGLYALQN